MERVVAVVHSGRWSRWSRCLSSLIFSSFSLAAPVIDGLIAIVHTLDPLIVLASQPSNGFSPVSEINRSEL